MENDSDEPVIFGAFPTEEDAQEHMHQIKETFDEYDIRKETRLYIHVVESAKDYIKQHTNAH